MSTSPPTKRSKPNPSTSDTPYELIYWPSIPGRAEHIRLLLEEAAVPYTDTALSATAMPTILSQISTDNMGDAHNPPPLAPPILKHGDLTISQTSNILLYLAKRHGLAGNVDGEDGEGVGQWRVNALVLTALDGLSNEVHDVHHPIATSLYYEDQVEEAKKKAKDYRENRLPKFLGYFERVLEGEASKGGEWLYGGQLTIADLVVWQCLDGVRWAFPKCMERLGKGGKYLKLWALCDRVGKREKIAAYLGSERRMKYSMGIYRHYPELDQY